MTDRHSGYLVALENDLREDDAEGILNALRMVKGVVSVQPVTATGWETRIGEERRDHLWREKLGQAIREVSDGRLERRL